MLASRLNKQTASHCYFFFAFLGFLGLWFSPFLVSLATGLIALTVLPYLKEIWINYKSFVLFFLAAILLVTFDYFRTDNLQIVSAKLMLIIGFTFLQLGAFLHIKNSNGDLLKGLLILSACVAIVNCIAVSHYFFNKEYYDTMLLQSKAIPVLGMHHIHFGILNGITLIVLLGVVINKKVQGRKAVLSFVLIILVILGIHILGSRTGLLAFYVSFLISLVSYALSTKKIKVLLQGLLLIIIILRSAYFFSTSFRNKITNSIEDYQSWNKGIDINYKSMAMRLEAYKTCWAIIKENPLIGVGSGEQEYEMQRMYEKQNSVLFKENRVGPHNQILEWGVKYGFIGMVLVLSFFILLIKGVGVGDYIYIALLCILFVSMQLESLFERQASIFFITLFIGLGKELFHSKNIINK